MNQKATLAAQIHSGHADAADFFSDFIRIRPTNLVERPWGGLRMLQYKGCLPLPDQKMITGLGIGESFEVCANTADPESRHFPSTVVFSDESTMELPTLLQRCGRAILGTPLYVSTKGQLPLLPKTLDIAELLSVQAHPPGNTELYVIINAEPGATIRLGFNQDIDACALKKRLKHGREQQCALLKLLQPPVDEFALQTLLAPALAKRSDSGDGFVSSISTLLRPNTRACEIKTLFESLKKTYWHLLDRMNAIPVQAGQIIYNATPSRLLDAGTVKQANAEVHALGNPQGKEILMLEVRRPGVTFRAWDNVRFPMRAIDIDQALAAMNLHSTTAEEFQLQPQSIADRDGVSQVVRSDAFNVDLVKVNAAVNAPITGHCFESLHAIEGSVVLKNAFGRLTEISQGESVLVPAAMERGSITSNDTGTLVRVRIGE